MPNPSTIEHNIDVPQGPSNELVRVKLKVDCFHNLYNIWTKGISNELCKYMAMDLAEDLCDIDFYLRIKVYMGLIIRTVYKAFNLCSNYPKSNSNSFKSYMEEHYPNQLLHNVKNANGNRQDILIVYTSLIYFNTHFYMNYLD